jgi:hypothetical protein
LAAAILRGKYFMPQSVQTIMFFGSVNGDVHRGRQSQSFKPHRGGQQREEH